MSAAPPKAEVSFSTLTASYFDRQVRNQILPPDSITTLASTSSR
jgi:hypothetical protein